MNCRELTEFLMAYLDGELDGEVCRCFESHLRMCPACMAYVDTYRASITLSRDSCTCTEGKPPLPNAPEELIQAILRATSHKTQGTGHDSSCQ
jgi:anti-sigma factor RsiW